MNKIQKIVTPILCLCVAVIFTYEITYRIVSNQCRAELTEAYQEIAKYNKLREVDEIFRENYVGDLDDTALMDGILAGYVYGTGDYWAAYYDAESMQARMDDLEGDMQGIGINVLYDNNLGAIEVINVMPDSPALEAGVEPGDLIVSIGEGDDVQYIAELGYYPAVQLLQGKAGTTSVFTVVRGKDYEETVTFHIKRGYVTEQTVAYHIYALDKSIGIIRIDSFDKETPNQFKAALEALQEAGCTSLIVDDRNNPGGELTGICTVLDMLLPEGPVIRTIDHDGNEEVIYRSDKQELNMPMAVLVNGSTASAGELFCSALQDYGKAIIVGTQTYGKGCMQTVQYLSDGSGISVTTRLYCPPFSDNFDGIGVTPDIIVEAEGALLEKNRYKVTDEEDNQLTAAVNALKKQANNKNK